MNYKMVGFVLGRISFVYDDESQILKRQEDGTSCTQDYIIGMI